MLAAINQLGSQQALPTEKIEQGVEQLLEYTSTHRNTVLHFHASDILLIINSNASYLILPKVRSRLAGYFYLTTPSIINNGAALIKYKNIHHVVSSAAEAKIHSAFHSY